MKLYAIEASGGEYDSCWESVISIWNRKEDAELEIKKLQALRDEAIVVKQPFLGKGLFKDVNSYEEYRKAASLYWEAKNLAGTEWVIIEYELNKSSI